MPMSDYIRGLRDKVGTDILMMPAAGGVVINDQGDVLLQLRSDSHTWGIPGGSLDPGEDIAECAVREVYEETGLQVVPERITSVLAGHEFIHTYPNGDQVAIISVMFRCRPVAGEPHVHDSESLDVRYFQPHALPDNMIPRHRLMVETALKNETEAFFRYDDKLDVKQLTTPSYTMSMREKVGQVLLMSPGASGIVFNDKNELLLQFRSDKHIWGLPGGAVEPGEEPAEGVIREVYEETGVMVQPQRIVAVMAGGDHMVIYDNGDPCAFMTSVFMCRAVSGEPHAHDGETLDARYFPLDGLPDDILPLHRYRIEKALENQPGVFFRPPDSI